VQQFGDITNSFGFDDDSRQICLLAFSGFCFWIYVYKYGEGAKILGNYFTSLDIYLPARRSLP